MDQNIFQPKKLRNASVTILNEILRVKAKLDGNLVKVHNRILMGFLNTFVREMKQRDKLFKSLYRSIYFTGSYYSHLRVSEPNEYDLNILLKLPFEERNISVDYQLQVPSYVKYKITDEASLTREDGFSTLFGNGFLIPEKVRSWFQSVVDKALETYRPPRRIAEVRCSGSGPARTITLVKKDGTKIDIDLVPVIEGTMDMKPPGIDRRVCEKFSGKLKVGKSKPRKVCTTLNQSADQPVAEGTTSQKSNKVPKPKRNKVPKPKRNKEPSQKCKKEPNQTRNTPQRTRHRFPTSCFLVPKPYKPPKQSPVNDAERARLWRAHYPKPEEMVIHNLGCVKPLIKLLKLLRDKEDWKILASYYLKTVVMWMIIENPNEESWKMDHLGDKFLEALEKLQSHVARRKLPYFFDSEYNLLEKLSEEQADNIQNRLHFIRIDVESDDEKLWNIFDCPRTFHVR